MNELKKLPLKKLCMNFCLAIACIAGVSYSAHTHHSITAQYDYDWPFDFNNAVFTRARWVNPHIYLFFDVENEQGEVEEWTVHTTGLQGLRSKGLGRDALIEGETYTVSGVRAHSGRPEGFLAEITLLDGQLIQVWTGDPNGN
ncbi:MAG: DUF6152 family protein [Gammaproteobacteria bacterium]|jgi:hypothetical protein|nr:DUF6152 family protein [Gammaproteobacteria bacterium]